MAVVPDVSTRVSTSSSDDVHLFTWTGLTGTDTGRPVSFPGLADRSVQMVGTFDSATVVLEGSNDGTNYVTLNDPQGDPISFTAAGLVAVSELTAFVRPRTSGGGGSSAVTVILLAKRAR